MSKPQVTIRLGWWLIQGAVSASFEVVRWNALNKTLFQTFTAFSETESIRFNVTAVRHRSWSEIIYFTGLACTFLSSWLFRKNVSKCNAALCIYFQEINMWPILVLCHQRKRKSCHLPIPILRYKILLICFCSFILRRPPLVHVRAQTSSAQFFVAWGLVADPSSSSFPMY